VSHSTVIVDTGPLVAALDRADRYHQWTVDQIERLVPPMLVCEPVLAEAMFLLRNLSRARDELLRLLGNGALSVAFRIEEHVPQLRELLRRYRDRPISLADACIVRMAELKPHHAVFTLDSDFTIYRKHGRMPVDLVYPAVP
jgi:predicted nucleic acid-binding protein